MVKPYVQTFFVLIEQKGLMNEIISVIRVLQNTMISPNFQKFCPKKIYEIYVWVSGLVNVIVSDGFGLKRLSPPGELYIMTFLTHITFNCLIIITATNPLFFLSSLGFCLICYLTGLAQLYREYTAIFPSIVIIGLLIRFFVSRVFRFSINNIGIKIYMIIINIIMSFFNMFSNGIVCIYHCFKREDLWKRKDGQITSKYDKPIYSFFDGCFLIVLFVLLIVFSQFLASIPMVLAILLMVIPVGGSFLFSGLFICFGTRVDSSFLFDFYGKVSQFLIAATFEQVSINLKIYQIENYYTLIPCCIANIGLPLFFMIMALISKGSLVSDYRSNRSWWCLFDVVVRIGYNFACGFEQSFVAGSITFLMGVLSLVIRPFNLTSNNVLNASENFVSCIPCFIGGALEKMGKDKNGNDRVIPNWLGIMLVCLIFVHFIISFLFFVWYDFYRLDDQTEKIKEALGKCCRKENHSGEAKNYKQNAGVSLVVLYITFFLYGIVQSPDIRNVVGDSFFLMSTYLPKFANYRTIPQPSWAYIFKNIGLYIKCYIKELKLDALKIFD